MTDTVANLILEHFKLFQVARDRIDRRPGELTIRQTVTHAAVPGLRLDRLERRLELHD